MISIKVDGVSVCLPVLLSLIIGWVLLVDVNATFAGTVKLPKTGQTTCYDTDGNVISCNGTGQDGEIQAGVEWPNPRFTDNENGTVTDNLTGLMWLKSGNCFGVKTWQESLDTVADLNANPGDYTCGGYTATYDDWVLPNINELESLVNAEVSNLASWLNGQGFLNMQPSSYWSSTTYVANCPFSWYIDMDSGKVYDYDPKHYTHYVLPVRTDTTSAPAKVWQTGQKTCYGMPNLPGVWEVVPCDGTTLQDGDVQAGVEWANPRFKDNDDGTITDNLTGLMWLKDANCFGLISWQEALDSISYLNVNPAEYTCVSYSATYDDWRLANKKEMRSLIDHSQYDPALDLYHPFINVFTGLHYWSSTTEPSYPDHSWVLKFYGGAELTDDKFITDYMWPVRGGIDIPTVTTEDVSSITSNGATSGGNVTSMGGATVTARGVCWSTLANPTTSDNHTTDGSGTGSFTSSITGLSPGTTYHVRAYATNSAGTAYGSDVSFTTSHPPCPECSTHPVNLTGIEFGPETACECSDATSISIGPGVIIKSGADITFKAPNVQIKSRFLAEEGANVRIKQE